ncbi:MAG TPA: hypothetical protein VMB80_13175 [Candidatus Acidoferrum sp.]|nr:hypothetical protein [Candidatus Acidoferrum sp.]
MKTFKCLVCCFSPALLALSLAACATSHPVESLGGGYEELAHPRGSASASEDMRVSFQYRAPDGKITPIWPALYGVNEVIHSNVAIFVGDVACLSSDPDHSRTTKPRLFAVQAPALPLDITDEILWRWSKMWGKDFSQAQQLFTLATPVEQGGRLELQIEFWTDAKDWPDKAVVQLDWDEVSSIMAELKTKGTVHKDLRWGTPYIAK